MSLIDYFKRILCHHQWDMSRSRKGSYVCRRCGARRA